MSLFYDVSRKELLDIRNEIFVSTGIPVLEKNGFVKSPFKSIHWGRNNLKDFSYDLCRVNEYSQLEKITAHISRGDRWIKVSLNSFELRPEIKSLDQLVGKDGMKFYLPPNSLTEMRLRTDDSIPLFNNHFYDHKLKPFYTKWGYEKSVSGLTERIKRDLSNINYFFNFWHTLHKPLVTDWEGNTTLNQ